MEKLIDQSPDMSPTSDDDEMEESGYVCGADGNVIVSSLNDDGTPIISGHHQPHQCSICSKVFVSTKGLVQHSIIHTDRKPFACEICGKAFRFKSNLFEHRSLHSGEQPYVCPFCGKACRLKGNLKKHLKTHVKEPNEIEQAYEAVTTAHASAAAAVGTDGVEGDDLDGQDGYESTPKPKRKTVAPKRTYKSASSVLSKLLKDENNQPLSEGARAFPSLIQMFDPSYSTEDFIQAARAVPFEKYDCKSCQLTFNCRCDMEAHCENIHDLSRRLVNAKGGGKSTSSKPFHWCEICLRDFEDQKAYDQHFFFHRRIRALINKGELHVSEPKIITYF